MATVSERVSTMTTTSTEQARSSRRGMTVPRTFSVEGRSPFDLVEWDLRTAAIKDEKGRVLFEQVDCEIPKRLEPARHQRRGEQVLLRRDQHSRSARPASASSSTG